MDLLQLFTGSENLYKYLLLGGIGLLMVSLFYPLNKRYELECQKDLYNKEITLLNHFIDNLNIEAKEAEANSQKVIDSIKTNKVKDSKIKERLKNASLIEIDSVFKKREEVTVKQITVDYNKARILTLQKHIQDFVKYESLFFWSGIICALAGIIGWFLLMRKSINKNP